MDCQVEPLNPPTNKGFHCNHTPNPLKLYHLLFLSLRISGIPDGTVNPSHGRSAGEETERNPHGCCSPWIFEFPRVLGLIFPAKATATADTVSFQMMFPKRESRRTESDDI